MHQNCDTVIISNKAYNAIIREAFAKHPVETGGILLGYILNNGIWVVMEMIPPGINGIFQTAYFEYDQDFVNYLGTSVTNQYKEPLQVLGLWHRHPGSMDYFSSTDDGTNMDFASRNPYGTISGLVNIDPKFRLTMYHLDPIQGQRPRNVAYTTVDVEIGDDLIPERFFKLRYIDGENPNLNPIPTQYRQTASREIPKATRNYGDNESKEKHSLLNSKWTIPILLVLLALCVVYILWASPIPWKQRSNSFTKGEASTAIPEATVAAPQSPRSQFSSPTTTFRPTQQTVATDTSAAADSTNLNSEPDNDTFSDTAENS